MKRTLRCRVATILIALSVCGAVAQAGLIHRYSFKDVKDSVGKVDVKLKGSATVADGKLVLKNEDSTPVDKMSYLEFAGPVLPKSGSVTLVAWFTVKDCGGFARILNFGESIGTEGNAFIYFSPRTGEGSARAAISATDASVKTNVDTDALDDGKPHMVAIVIDGAAKKLHVFVDGKEPRPAEDLGENTLDKVKSVESWLGKSSFSADPPLSGSIDEFRVYDHALSAEEVSAANKAGPDALPAAASQPAAK